MEEQEVEGWEGVVIFFDWIVDAWVRVITGVNWNAGLRWW